MGVKEKILALAQDEIGYLEKSKQNYSLYGSECLYPKISYAGADNYTKYAYELHAAGHGHPNGHAWCMTFICWLIWKCTDEETANKLLCEMLSSASTMDTKDAMVRCGRQVPLNKAEACDIVFRSRKGGGHVGLVIGRTADGRIITIEGNTSATDATSWNGGAVAKHTGASWEWCVRPDWSLVEETWGWLQADGYWFYQNSDGVNWHGWKKIKETGGEANHWYWFDERGIMATGGKKIDGRWYFFMPEGPLEGALCITDTADMTGGAQNVWYL